MENWLDELISYSYFFTQNKRSMHPLKVIDMDRYIWCEMKLFSSAIIFSYLTKKKNDRS